MKAMVTGVLTALLAVSAAEAEFRFLDPVPVIVDEAPAGPASPIIRPLPPAAASPQAAVTPRESYTEPHWDVKPGEMLGDTLRRWGARVGVEVHVLTDRRYRLEGSRRFVGNFSDVVAALLDSLSWLPHPPHADITEQNVLLIRHASPAGHGGSMPWRTMAAQGL